jgi:SsrA-binding protein
MDKVTVTNRKARRDYEILKVWEAGIELEGSEVKSIRAGRANLNDSFARLENGQILLYNMHITPYAYTSFFNVDPVRVRRLLLHKNQINRIAGEVLQRGFTLIPLRLYFNERGYVKIELALSKGKKLYDRRRDLRVKEAELEIKRAIKSRRHR